MAREFEDSLSRTWRINLADRRVVKRVRRYAQVNLDDFRRGRMPLTQDTDRETFAAVLWACLEPQADARGIDRTQFVAMLLNSDGLALQRATAALLREIITLIPGHERLSVPSALPGEYKR